MSTRDESRGCDLLVLDRRPGDDGLPRLRVEGIGRVVLAVADGVLREVSLHVLHPGLPPAPSCRHPSRSWPARGRLPCRSRPRWPSGCAGDGRGPDRRPRRSRPGPAQTRTGRTSTGVKWMPQCTLTTTMLACSRARAMSSRSTRSDDGWTTVVTTASQPGCSISDMA